MLHRQVIAPQMVGRAQELEALEQLLDQARAGRGGAAVIGGDAGVGKTRLCRQLKTAAAQRDIRVVEGRCSVAEAAVPYGPFMDALRFRLSRGEGEAAAQVLAPVLAHVAPLFAELTDSPAATAHAAQATAMPFEPIFRVLQRLTGHGPVLFVLEDIHWADQTSRDLLHYVARRVAGLPMLLVATYRTDEIHDGHPVHRLVATLGRERTALRVQLEPLTRADVEHMLRGLLATTPTAAFVDAIFERTEGNPLFIEELTGVLLQGGRVGLPDRADLAAVSCPSTLDGAVRERLAPLSPEAHEALLAAAVIGRRFRFDVLAAALGWSEERLVDVVEELVEARIIQESVESGEEVYGFRHSLVQEVLYSSTIGRRRRLWHRRIAAAIEACGGGGELPHTTLAHHFRQGGDHERARIHTVLAGDEAARLCAWRDAESMYEEALAALERTGGDPAAEADILERMTEVAWWQNRLDAVEQYAAEALSLRRALNDRAAAALLLRRLANLYAYQRAAVERGTAALHEALELIDDDAAERVPVLNDLGRLRVLHGDFAEATVLFERSLALCGGRSDCAEEALALVMLGRLAVHGAQITAGTSRLDVAFALLTEDAIPVERAAEVYHAGIRALDAAREHQRARAWVEAAVAYGREHGAGGDVAIYQAYQAAVHRRAGEWDAGVAVAERAVAELRDSGRAELREALRILGDLRRGRGELDAARTAYEEAAALGQTDAAIGHALVLLAGQQAEEAVALLTGALAAHTAADRLFMLRVLPILVEARVAAGQLEQARGDAQQLYLLAAASDYRPGRASAAQAAGLVHAAAGETTRAVRALRGAMREWHELELPFEAARTALALADQLISARRGRAEALSLANQAASVFERLGAALDVSRAHATLRRAGVRVRRAARAPELPPPLDRLTPRELEVLYEMARGHTNKRIARTLSMSPRTVGNHVSAILAKLECATRTEASRLVLDARTAVAAGG